MEPQALSQQLLFQLGNLVDGNQVSKQALIAGDSQARLAQIELEIHWQFEGVEHNQCIAGGARAEDHFHHRNQFEEHSHILHTQALQDMTLRQSFLDNLINNEKMGIQQAVAPVVFHRFTPFSFEEECRNCHGNGKVRCYSCHGSGKKDCDHCHGMGRITEQVPEYRDGVYVGSRSQQRLCYSCSGSGKKTCPSCYGSGDEKCRKCSGYGYFMHTRRINAQATAQYFFYANVPEYKTELEQCFSNMGIEFCNQKINFVLQRQQAINSQQQAFYYQGETPWLKQSFQLKGKTYQCYAFSNPPYPYIRPTIFDDLFADELQFLQNTLPEKRKPNKKKAFAFFSRYAGQPALDLAMRNIAEQRQNSQQDMASAVQKACDYFISDKMAEQLGQYLNRIMDKVSPTYAGKTWCFFSLISSLGLFLFFAMLAENLMPSSPTSLIISALLITLIVALAIGLVATPISLLMVALARRNIPREYWQKMRNKEPFKRNLILNMLSTLLALGYGYGASQKQLPSWFEPPLMHISQPSCQLLEQLHLDKNVCPQDWRYLNKQEISAITQFYSLPENKISQEQKTMFIQQHLLASGIRINVDGKFGKQTEKLAISWLRQRGVALTGNENLETYYFLFKTQME